MLPCPLESPINSVWLPKTECTQAMSLVCLFKSEFLNRYDSLTGILLLITIQSRSLHHSWTALLLLFVFARSLDRETQQNIYVTLWFMLPSLLQLQFLLHVDNITPYIDLQLIPCPRVNMSCTNAAKGSEWHAKLQNQALCCLELVTPDPHA